MDSRNVVIVGTGGGITVKQIAWTGQVGEESDVNDDIKVNSNFLKAVYKCCGYKLGSSIPADFKLLHVFNVNSFPASHRGLDDDEIIMVFGKDNGRAGTENKYELPPPVDTVIFHGNMCLVKATISDVDSTEPVTVSLEDLTARAWDKIYADLFGGFYDCDEDASDDDDDDDAYAELPTTRNGYAKDGFVVDDDDDDDYGFDDDDDFCLTDED